MPAKLPEPPVKKMPSTRAVLMLGVALIFSIFIFVFATLPFSAPVLFGAAVKVAVYQHVHSGALADIVGATATAVGGAAEILTGVGVAAVAAIGEFAADLFDLLAWLIFTLWYAINGMKFFGSRNATKRLFTVAGSALVGMIPIVNVIPTVLVGVAITVWQTRKEDAEKEARYASKIAAMQAQRQEQQREALQTAQGLAAGQQAQQQAAEDARADAEAQEAQIITFKQTQRARTSDGSSPEQFAQAA